MLRRSARNFASQLAGLLVSFADRIFLVGLLVRLWGPNQYSDWSVLLAVAGLLSFAELGFQLLNANRLAAAHARGDAEGYARALSFGMFLYAAIACTLVIVVAAIVAFVDLRALLGLQRLGSGEATLVFVILALASIVRVSRASISQIYRSRDETYRGFLLEAGITGATVTAAIVAVLADASPVVLASVYLGAEIVFGWGVMGADVARRYSGLRLAPRWPRPGELGALRRDIFWYALLQGLPTGLLHIPILILGALGLGGAGLTSFVIQRTLVNFGRNFPLMLSMSTGVELARLIHAGAHAEAARGAEDLARLNALLAGALTSGVVVFGPAVIAAWTGETRLSDALVLTALAAPALVCAAAAPLSMLCAYADRPRPQGIALCVQLVLGGAVAIAAGQAVGVVGVAAGFALGECVGVGVVLPALSARAFGLDYWRLFLSCLVVSSLVVAIAGPSGWALRELIGLDSLPRLAAAIGLWGTAVIAPTFYLGLPPAIRSKVDDRVRALLARS